MIPLRTQETFVPRAQFVVMSASVAALGRKPRRRVADLMIASTAAANRLPLFTTSPDDHAGLSGILTVVPVDRPR